VEGSPGADDNASAIAAILELYRLMSPYQFRRTVRFVAFTLEEPPFFSTEQMGSMQYASNCKKRKDQIDLMICLEMVGFASRKCHQEFPMIQVKREYPKHGNFFSVVSLPSAAMYVHQWKRLYNDSTSHKIFDFVGPASIPGMDLSDHNSFIKAGYPALMLTDTGFYRNKNYHTARDTIDTINFSFLSRNIWDTYLTLRELLNLDELVSTST
jgi:Zn-dependent M28 family amino/carboxypeptidase